MSNPIATTKLIEYLRIKTVHPEPDYSSAVKFLKAYAEEIGVDSYKEIEVCPGRIVTLMSYYGSEPEKPSILLNSHTDVVPVDQRFWKCDAFEGKQYENGDIYGRGVQDMKSVGIQHLELIRKMKLNNVRPKRTIHLTFVPDEEIGGLTGLAPFLEMDEFKNLDVALAFDEGQASDTEEFSVYYGERVAWWFNITCNGNTGHGSRFIENTAAEKLQKVMNSFLAFREEEKNRLHDKCSCLKLGDVTTINLTSLSGGLARNIVPSEFKATFDIRITPKTSITEFEEKLKSWLSDAEGGDKGSITYECKEWSHSKGFALTSVDATKNPWWKQFLDSCKELDIKTSTEVFPAATDSRFLREKGIPAFGFTPLNNTPILLHDHNEFVNDKIFEKGVDIYYKIVLDMANMP